MSDANINALPVGHEFDGYRILRVLGAGGFGITYLAEEIQIGRKVAIKEYLPSGYAARAADSSKVRAISSDSKERFDWGLDRFRQEAKTLVAFEHPNIIAVHRYFEDNGTAYLVMQYVEGKPLDALLGRGKTLAESEIHEVIGPILDGLEDVHAAQFLHRDIKPANIYIRKDGRPVLLDFGAARQAFGGEVKSITAIVSEGYAPFEQYEARGDQGPWTDVYALGAVIYRCITGERPPAAPERISARVRGAPDPMVPAKTLGGGQYGATLLAATDRALGVTRDERPQSVSELRELLRGDGGTIAPSRRVASAARREGAGESGQPTAPPPPPVAPVPVGVNPRPRSKTKTLAFVAAAAIVVVAVGAYFAFPPGKPVPGTASAPSSPEDSAAQLAATEIAAETERAKATTAKGELERGRDELRAARRRAEEALARRPGHAGLQRALDGVVAAETELAQRIAARVKELIAYAEREAGRGDFDEVQRYVDQISRLDLSAGARERQRFAEARRSAGQERARQEEARKQEARRQEAEARAKFAGQRLDQARAAFERDRLAEARRLADDAESLAKQAAAAAPGSLAAEAVQRDIQAFRRELAKRIAERVAALVREARELMRAGKLDDAEKRLDEAAELEPAAAEIGPARRDIEAARREAEAARKRGDETDSARKRADEAKKAEDERRRREEAERRKKEEEAKKRPGADKPDAPATPGAVNLTGRTGTLSRISSEKRAVMRIQLQFGAGGALAATCTTESAEGGQSPCFGQASGGGRWSLNGATLCLSTPVLNLPGNTCYQVSGSGNQLTLSGPGLLSGAMFLR